jgi:competence protein ComEA
LIAGLALAALAAQRRPSLQLQAAAAAQASAERGASVRTGVTRPASSATVRALRDGERVELNTALPQDLMLLPGIGPKLAQRIVDERTRRGGFAAVDELLAVRGMGPKTLAKLSELVEVKPRAAPLRTDRSDMTRSAPP